jgi:mannan endo-1,4-beta-mannosidase
MRVRSATVAGIVLSAVLGVSPVAAAPRTVALGVSMYPGTDPARLDDFRASIGGQRVATWTIWTGWDPEGSGAFPAAAVTGARQRGAVPIIWWEPYPCCEPDDPRWSRNRNIADGLYDDYIRDFARQAKESGRLILIRFAHQANSDYLPWAWDYSATDDNTVRTFKAAWRHVVRTFRKVGATNVRWVWTVATQTCAGDGKRVSAGVRNCMSRPLGYPGHKWVDYMGFTWENWGDAGPGAVVGSKAWVSMLDGFRPIVRRLSRVSTKPIMAVASASAPGGGDQARWIRQGYRQVHRHLPRVVAVMWLNVDLSGAPHFHRDWSLGGLALEAYAEIAARPEFQGRIRAR